MLVSQTYKFLGQLVATALVHGHPGPRCFSLMITKYIVMGEQPLEFLQEDIVATDCKVALAKVQYFYLRSSLRYSYD